MDETYHKRLRALELATCLLPCESKSLGEPKSATSLLADADLIYAWLNAHNQPTPPQPAVADDEIHF